MTSASELLLDRIRAATADEYEIERELGRGGMAAVFLARDIALQRRVAIKVMLPDLINVAGLQDRFVIEARTAAHLDHPGIVAVYAVRQRAGLLFIVMKYIEGHTLEAILRAQGQIDPTATALIGGRVAEALSFAHGEGVVHRDVKPSNIMIDPRGRPVVTDFGIARVMTAQSITVAGSMLGTPSHMSPEQCQGLPATAASDQYALGVTMYEMLTGRVPFTGTLFELITAHREMAPPPLSDFVAGVDPELEQTVMRMLAKNPADRWGSMAEVAHHLASHTSVSRGDESLRATLVMTDGGGAFAASGADAAAAGVLTPPGGGSTPVTPVSGPPSPVPVSVPVSPIPVSASPVLVEEPAPASGTKPRGVKPLWIAAVLLVAIVAAAIYWGARGGSGGSASASAARQDSGGALPAGSGQPGAASVLVDSARRDSIARDSVTRDSVARDSVTRDSAARALRDSVVKDSVARDSSARVAAAKAAAAKDSATKAASARVAARRDTARARGAVRPESLSVQCARLLERASLGEKLTDAERAQLKLRCPRK